MTTVTHPPAESFPDSEDKSSNDDSAEESGESSVGEGEGEESRPEPEPEQVEDDQGPFGPKHHPLLRPGAMPKKVSQAVLNTVVGMVEGELGMPLQGR